MDQEMTEEQRRALQQDLTLIQRLLALSFVERHETRFANEVALVAPTLHLKEVEGLVDEVMSPPVKPAGAALSTELAANPLLEAMGGVRDNQTLYLKTLDNGLSLYVAFWPWGGGETVTIKIGVFVDGDG